jgi:hypothetical protein
VFGDAVTYTASCKITAAGSPLRGATVEVVDENGTPDAEGVTGRSGYMTATIPEFYPGTTDLHAIFAGSLRYVKSQTAVRSFAVTVPTATPNTTADGTEWWTTVAGNGATLVNGDTATADYNGYLESDGLLFGTSVDSSLLSFQLGTTNLLPGLAQAVVGMKAGEIRAVVIPAADAYGASPPSGSQIPANANLVFEIRIDSLS